MLSVERRKEGIRRMGEAGRKVMEFASPRLGRRTERERDLVLRNQDEGLWRKREMKRLLNGTNHRGEVIRAAGNHRHDNMVRHELHTQRKIIRPRSGEERGGRAAS